MMDFAGLRGADQAVFSEQDITLECGQRKLQIKFCTPSIINVKMLPHEPYGAAEKMIVEKEEWDPTNVSMIKEGPNKARRKRKILEWKWNWIP